MDGGRGLVGMVEKPGHKSSAAAVHMHVRLSYSNCRSDIDVQSVNRSAFTPLQKKGSLRTPGFMTIRWRGQCRALKLGGASCELGGAKQSAHRSVGRNAEGTRRGASHINV